MIAATDPSAGISVCAGIVISCSVAFVMALCGYKMIHARQRWQWVTMSIALATAIACGGKSLIHQVGAPPTTAKQVISYGGLVAGYFISFGGTVSDFSVYQHPDTSKYVGRIFLGLWLWEVYLDHSRP